MISLLDRFATIDGVLHHYVEMPGPGEDVVLIHGFASSSYTWDQVARRLNQRGFHVWALDLKGFGWSGKPAKGKYDVFNLMEDVVAWMDSVGLQKASLAGSSLGGGIASLLAIIYPEKVNRLVLIDSLAPFDIPHPLLIRLSRLPLAPMLARRFVTRTFVRGFLRSVFHDQELVTPDKVEAYYQPLASPGCMRAQALAARSLDPGPFRKYLYGKDKLKAETLIIWGEYDSWIPLKYGRMLVEQGKGRGSFVVLPDCGHLPQEEKPDDVARCMGDFLNDVEIRRVGDVPYCHVEKITCLNELNAGGMI